VSTAVAARIALHHSLHSIIVCNLSTTKSRRTAPCAAARAARAGRATRASAWWRVVALACSARGEGAPVGKALMSARAVVQLGEGAAHLTIVGCPDRRLLHRRSIGAVDGLSIGAVEELSGPDEIVKGGVRVRVRVLGQGIERPGPRICARAPVGGLKAAPRPIDIPLASTHHPYLSPVPISGRPSPLPMAVSAGFYNTAR
jgi:hypothetical protein